MTLLRLDWKFDLGNEWRMVTFGRRGVEGRKQLATFCSSPRELRLAAFANPASGPPMDLHGHICRLTAKTPAALTGQCRPVGVSRGTDPKGKRRQLPAFRHMGKAPRPPLVILGAGSWWPRSCRQTRSTALQWPQSVPANLCLPLCGTSPARSCQVGHPPCPTIINALGFPRPPASLLCVQVFLEALG